MIGGAPNASNAAASAGSMAAATGMTEDDAPRAPKLMTAPKFNSNTCLLASRGRI